MSLEIQIENGIEGRNTAAVIVKLIGSLDSVTAPELEQQLGLILAGPVTNLVFDLAQLKFISTAGLRVFGVARKLLRERGGQASLIRLQPQIQEVFDIMKSLPGMPLFTDMAEMDRHLEARQRSHTQPL